MIGQATGKRPTEQREHSLGQGRKATGFDSLRWHAICNTHSNTKGNTMLTTRSFLTEGTGGGCTALVRYQKDGTVLVVTDGNLSADLSHTYTDGTQCNAALFATRGDWEDSGNEPVLIFEGTASAVLEWASYVAAA